MPKTEHGALLLEGWVAWLYTSRKKIPGANMPAGWNWSLLFHERDMLGTLGAGSGDFPLFWILLPFTTRRLLCIPQNLQPCCALLQGQTGWGGSEFSQEPRAGRLLCHRALLLCSLSFLLFVPILQKRKLSLRKGKCHTVHPHGTQMGTSYRASSLPLVCWLSREQGRVLLTVDSPVLASVP